MESVSRVLLLLKIMRVMCLVWGCDSIETDSFNAKMVYQQGIAQRTIDKMAAKFVCSGARARLCTLRIDKISNFTFIM